MSGDYQKIKWQEKLNDFVIDCSLDIAIHSTNNRVILLIIPGVDGSVDGYENKYVRIAEEINQKQGATVVRMSNPFISSYFWESNIRNVIQYIEDNASTIAGSDDIGLRIMAHSAGAGIISQIAWEYPFISKLLLINPATKLNPTKIKNGLFKFGDDKVTILVGSKDPSLKDITELKIKNTIVIDGADHNFSGDAFASFLEAPKKYLFGDKS